jgi:hypothetical protein
MEVMKQEVMGVLQVVVVVEEEELKLEPLVK